MILSATYIRSIIDYQPDTGHFLWKIARRGVKAGARAGSIDKQAGYEQIGIDGKLYRSHRLAWLYLYGSWPEGQIDHINGDRADNRAYNLREVSNDVNNQNRKGPNKNNIAGVLGVHFVKRCGKYSSAIMKDRKRIHLGYFETVEGAYAAHVAKRRELFEGNTL